MKQGVPIDIIKKRIELRTKLLKMDASQLFRQFIPYVNPSYSRQWYHTLIADKCQLLLEGKIKKLMVFIPPQHGKALAIDTPILTANRGWCSHGSLRVGDYVFSPNGSAVRVEAVTHHYKCESSIVAFAEGEPIISANQHEWGCFIPNSSHKAIYYPRIETREIQAKTKDRSPYLLATIRNDKCKHFIKAITPCGEKVVNCIQVEGGYYLAGRELRPTHNSEIISRCFPAWALGRNPDLKIVGSSYTIDLAAQFSRSIQRIIDSREYQEIFPDTFLNGSNLRTDTKGYLRNVDLFETVGHRGFYKAVGVGGGLTGTPVDIGIIDDPVKDAAEAYSATYRQRVWDWYTSVLLTRLHNESKQLFIMTRWHEDDLAGRILAHEDDWDVLSIPAICEVHHDGGISKREVGDALWPERHSLERLREAEKRSARVFSALYQQHPTADGGNIIKSAWFKKATVAEFEKKHRGEPIIFFLDTAFTEKTANDPSGIIATCKIGNDLYITHAEKFNLNFPHLIRRLPGYVRAHGYTNGSTIRIEPKANGISVIDELKDKTDLNVTRTPVPKDSKETRLNVAAPSVEGGHVYLVDGQWNDAFIDEVCGFPVKPHDEFADVLGYAIDYHLTNPFKPIDKKRLARLAY